MAPMFKIISTLLSLAGAMALPQAQNHTLEKRMTYRDNSIAFRINIWGMSNTLGDQSTFTIRDLSITNGQDPQGRNYINEVKSGYRAGRTDEMIYYFTVGRKKSKQVADWWNMHIPITSSTFQESPGELNFAFSGDLRLWIPGNTDPLTQESIEWFSPDILIGQGSSFASNNWWFGGKSCRPSGRKFAVICRGTKTSTGEPIDIEFLRGGNEGFKTDNPVDRIDIVGIGFNPGPL